jgi:hypothetical protein
MSAGGGGGGGERWQRRVKQEEEEQEKIKKQESGRGRSYGTTKPASKQPAPAGAEQGRQQRAEAPLDIMAVYLSNWMACYRASLLEL